MGRLLQESTFDESERFRGGSNTTMGSPGPLPLLLLLCTGNICRSPIAEALFKHYFGRTDQRAQVISRGLSVRAGQPPHHHSISVAAARQVLIDPAKRAAKVTALDVQASTVIFVMEAYQRAALIKRYPQAAGKVFLLQTNGDIPDPLGKSRLAFETVWQQIDAGVQEWMQRLRNTDLLLPTNRGQSCDLTRQHDASR
jgi:protein-tyrosine phosphatase